MARIPWKYYSKADSRGNRTLFNVDICEHCGEETLAPNTVSTREKEEKLQRLGLVEKEIPSLELWPTDDNRNYACDNCL